jgi:hypothetical protein
MGVALIHCGHKKTVLPDTVPIYIFWVQGRDLNPRPSGYEPDELPGCSTLQHLNIELLFFKKSH